MPEFEQREKLQEARAAEQATRSQLRGAVMLLIGPAIARLARAARGEASAKFKNDHELRACIALARLAPKLIDHRKDDGEEMALPHNPYACLTDEEFEKVLAFFEHRAEEIPEEIYKKMSDAWEKST